ncbi:MAG: redoxin domain-containing protein [Chloroflexi bacterium]|nr:MAG: redoxin domain-containing protein [Chloroflexota bacterium]
MPDETRTLKVGDQAPDFALKGTGATEFKLTEARGKNVVLNFFPAAFSPVCSNQMPRIQEQKSQFGEDTLVFGASVDGMWALEAFKKQTGIDFPILSDYFPHGEVARRYGVLMEEGRGAGAAERAVIGIDKQGKVRYIDVHPILDIPDLTECAVALKS